MRKRLFRSARTYAVNYGKHLKLVFTLKESPWAALKALGRDTVKLERSVAGKSSHSRRKATRLVEEGRVHYNYRRYDLAEESFRNALLADSRYALAHTYLGYALYKQNRAGEAVQHWEEAVAIDPHSEAADKAERKLGMIRMKNVKINTWVEEQLKKQ